MLYLRKIIINKTNMECNSGTIDRIIRFILGATFIWVGYEYSAWWYLLATLLILTSFAGFCPLYKLIGVNTCRSKLNKENNKETTEVTGKSKNIDNNSSQEKSVLDSDDGPSIESWKGPQQ